MLRQYTELQRAENRDYNLLWRLAFPEKSRENVRRWRLANLDKRREYERKRGKRTPNPDVSRRACRRFRERHKIRLREKAKLRRINDVNWHLRCVLRCRLLAAMRNDWKTGSAIALLGCSIESFKLYLESKFEPGMTWQNYGKGLTKWNIDHIMPCAIFDLRDPEHQKRCFHFSNMQPMWAIENSSKGAQC